MRTSLRSNPLAPKALIPAIRLGLLLGLGSTVAAAQFSASDPVALSRNVAGTALGDHSSRLANARSNQRVMSDNGRYIAITSLASDLPVSIPVGPDPNRNGYLYDSFANTMTLMSPNATGTSGANNDSLRFVISDHGRYCAFLSHASDLVPGFVDNNGFEADCYLRDLNSNTTTLISASLSGPGGSLHGVSSPSISKFGDYIFFMAESTTDLTGLEDGNGVDFLGTDLFRMNRMTGTVELVNLNMNGDASSNRGVFSYDISDDGRYVVFDSTASNLHPLNPIDSSGVFVRDMHLQTTMLATANPPGSTTVASEGTFPRISKNAKVVVFFSISTELTSDGDVNNHPDVFTFDFENEVTELISKNSLGTGSGDGASIPDQISADGRYVLYSSLATDIVPGANSTGHFALYLYDRSAGTTQLASANHSGTTTINEDVRFPRMSSGGRIVTYHSAASDVVNGLVDTAGGTDIFVRDMASETSICLSLKADGTQVADGLSFDSLISAAGNRVVFTSLGSDLTALADTNVDADVFSVTLDTNLVMRPFCDPMDVNSTGASTVLSGLDSNVGTGGTPPPGGGNFTSLNLQATSGPPTQYGYFLIGTLANDPGVVVSSGRLCLDMTGNAQVVRYNNPTQGGRFNSIGQFDAAGVLQNLMGTAPSTGGTGYDVPQDFPDPIFGMIRPGDTYHFQFWHRDVGGTSNFSNGLTVTF